MEYFFLSCGIEHVHMKGSGWGMGWYYFCGRKFLQREIKDRFLWDNCTVTEKRGGIICYLSKKNLKIYSGLGTAFFCVLNASFFYVLLKNATFLYLLFRVFGYLWDPKEWCILLRSFLKNIKECKERNVVLPRTQRSFAKNVKNATF